MIPSTVTAVSIFETPPPPPAVTTTPKLIFAATFKKATTATKLEVALMKGEETNTLHHLRDLYKQLEQKYRDLFDRETTRIQKVGS